MARTFGLKRVALNHLFVPSTEGADARRVGRLGVGVMPELLARGPIADGSLVDLVPGHFCPSSCTGTAGIWSPSCWTH